MSLQERETLWARLRDTALVQGELPALESAPTPWFVRTMLGIAGWIGALFLLGFVGVGFAFIIENEGASIAVGMMACAGAAALFYANPKGDFITQFGFAISLTGQALILFGLARSSGWDAGATAFMMAIVQALLFFLPNFLHRVWASGTAGVALAVALFDWRLQALAAPLLVAGFAWIWLREFADIANAPMRRAAGYGLALAILAAVTLQTVEPAWGWHRHARHLDNGLGAWMSAVLPGLVFVGAIAALLVRERVAMASRSGGFALAAAGVVALVSLKAPGIAAALTLLCLGYANGNRVLAGLGILALLSYLSHYYYSLHLTLLHKSGILVSFGIALLLLRLGMRRYWPAAATGGSGHA